MCGRLIRLVPLFLGFLTFAANPSHATAAPGRGPRLGAQLAEQAPKIVEQLLAENVKSVGVLKFYVRMPGRRTSDRVGEMNWRIAQRLETALILANPRDSARQLQIVHNASDVVSKLSSRPNHFFHDRHQDLFRARYPLAWGSSQVRVDAFVSGMVQVDSDMKGMQISLFAVKEKQPRRELARFSARMEGGLLPEFGESFYRRESSGGQREDPFQAALRVHTNPQDFPLNHADAEVILQIYYDDQLATGRQVGSRWVIDEPAEGQRVRFVLKRGDDSDVVYGAVLKVNGENTLYRQRKTDYRCAKWILESGSTVKVLGFQTPDQHYEKFEVLSDRDSDAAAMDYGRDVGTISLVVFRERPPLPLGNDLLTGPGSTTKDKTPSDHSILVHPPGGDLEPSSPKEPSRFAPPKISDAERVDIIMDSEFNPRGSKTLAELQNSMRLRQAGVNKRGLIVHGDRQHHRVRVEPREWEREPVLSIVIHYRPVR